MGLGLLIWLGCVGSGAPVAHWVTWVGGQPVATTVLHSDGTVLETWATHQERYRVDPEDDVLRAVELPSWAAGRAPGGYPVAWGASAHAQEAVLTRDGARATITVDGGRWQLEEGVLTGVLGPLTVRPGQTALPLVDLAEALGLPAPAPPRHADRATWIVPVVVPEAPGQTVGDGVVEVRPPLRLEVAAPERARIAAWLDRAGEVSWTTELVPRTPEETWARREGGCLSQALLLDQWAREEGRSSRVVVGLLWRAEGEAGRLVWHAWVEVDTGEPAGWVGIDPSAGAWTDARYLRLGLHEPDRSGDWLDRMAARGWSVTSDSQR